MWLKMFSVLLVGGTILRRSTGAQQADVIVVAVGSILSLSACTVRLGPMEVYGLRVHLPSSPNCLTGHDTRVLQFNLSRVPRGVGRGKRLWMTNLLPLPVQQGVLGQLLRGESLL